MTATDTDDNDTILLVHTDPDSPIFTLTELALLMDVDTADLRARYEHQQRHHPDRPIWLPPGWLPHAADRLVWLIAEHGAANVYEAAEVLRREKEGTRP